MERSLVQRQTRDGTSRRILRASGLVYIGLMVLIPLMVILQDGLRQGLGELIRQVTLPIAWSAILLSLWTSSLMTVINTFMGLATAYALVRFDFPGKRVLNAVIDLPLSIPTLVTGVMLVMLYGPQEVIGRFLLEKFGLQIIFAKPGIILSLLFISFPFVVRNIQPVLADLDQTQERAAATLGAKPWTIFTKIVLPALIPPMLSGSLLSFSRAIGEFGAVVIVAGNIPLKTQTGAVYVLGAVESENRLGASAVSLVLIGIAFSVLALANLIQNRWGAHK